MRPDRSSSRCISISYHLKRVELGTVGLRSGGGQVVDDN